MAFGTSVFAQSGPSAEAIDSIEGTYYGTFFCNETGEMAVSQKLEDGGLPPMMAGAQ